MTFKDNGISLFVFIYKEKHIANMPIFIITFLSKVSSCVVSVFTCFFVIIIVIKAASGVKYGYWLYGLVKHWTLCENDVISDNICNSCDVLLDSGYKAHKWEF